METRQTRHVHVIDFIETACVHVIGEKAGEPLLLEDWQKDFIRDLYTEYLDERRAAQGREPWVYLYQSSVLGVPRGAGKSTLAGAICLAELAPMPWNTAAPRVIVSAVTRDNAMQVWGPAADMVRRSHQDGGILADMFMANKNVIWCDENRGEMWRVSADGKAQFGGLPSFTVRDELHAWTAEKHIQLSEALMTALAKRFNSRAMTATTAGSDKQSILGRLYDDALRSDHREDVRPGFIRIADPDKRFLMHWYEAPAEMPAEEPDTWRSAHPASWIDEDAVRAQRNDPSIGDDEFERQWLNRWTKSSHSWFKTDVWKRNGPPAHPAEAIPAPGPIFVGIDGAWSDDCTALVWAYPVSLDEIHLRAHIWGTRDDLEGQYHTFVPGGTMDMELVRAKIHALAERYKVREIAYDPKFFTDTAHRLSDDGFTMVDFPRSGPVYGAATQDFYRLVNGFGARHDGDEAFASHIESTAAVQTEGGWKIMKLKQSRKIDATPAAIMAVSRAKTYIEKGAVSYAFSGRKKENDAT